MGGVEVPLCEVLPRQLENASLPKSSAMGLLGKFLNTKIIIRISFLDRHNYDTNSIIVTFKGIKTIVEMNIIFAW